MYPVCRGGHIAPGVGRRTERESGGRANRSTEGCYRRRDGRVKRAREKKPSETEWRRVVRGARGGSLARVRVMICRVVGAPATTPTLHRSRKRPGGAAESQPRFTGFFFFSPRPRLISFPPFFLFYLIREQQLQPRDTRAAIPRSPLFLSPLLFHGVSPSLLSFSPVSPSVRSLWFVPSLTGWSWIVPRNIAILDRKSNNTRVENFPSSFFKVLFFVTQFSRS